MTLVTDNYFVKIVELMKDKDTDYIIYINNAEHKRTTNIKNTCHILVDFIKNKINNEPIDISNEITFYGVECYATSKYVGYLCKLSKKSLVLPELNIDDIFRVLIQI